MPDAGTPSNRHEALEAVAAAVGGTLVEGKVTGGYAVVVEDGPRRLTMDLQMVSSGAANMMHTRVWAHFIGRDDVRLTVRPRSVFDTLAEKLGFGSKRLLGRELARRFTVRGRPEPRVRSVLSGGLADALGDHGRFRVEVGPAPRRVRRTTDRRARRMQVLAPGVDTDVARMVSLFRVAREAMSALERAGVASRDRLD